MSKKAVIIAAVIVAGVLAGGAFGVYAIQQNLVPTQSMPSKYHYPEYFIGDGVPSDNLGVDGDEYYDRVTGLYYRKSNGHWEVIQTSDRSWASSTPVASSEAPSSSKSSSSSSSKSSRTSRSSTSKSSSTESSSSTAPVSSIPWSSIPSSIPPISSIPSSIPPISSIPSSIPPVSSIPSSIPGPVSSSESIAPSSSSSIAPSSTSTEVDESIVLSWGENMTLENINVDVGKTEKVGLLSLQSTLNYKGHLTVTVDGTYPPNENDYFLYDYMTITIVRGNVSEIGDGDIVMVIPDHENDVFDKTIVLDGSPSGTVYSVFASVQGGISKEVYQHLSKQSVTVTFDWGQ